MIPNTFTQRGAAGADSGSDRSPSPASGWGIGSAMTCPFQVGCDAHPIFTIHLVTSQAQCLWAVSLYGRTVPRLWNTTIAAHRREVHNAILDTTAALVAEHGLLSVTMSRIAEQTGIGRATLYKYFPDVEAVLLAWHERQVTGHLEHLTELRDRAGNATERLAAVLQAYAAHSSPGHHDGELAAVLHRDTQVGHAQRRLHDLIRDLLIEGAQVGDIRDDVAPDELASYCLHALTAAYDLPSTDAVRRLVTVTLAGLHPPVDHH